MREVTQRLINSDLEVLIAIPDSEQLLFEFERQGFRGHLVDSLEGIDPAEYDVLVIDVLDISRCLEFMHSKSVVVAVGKNSIGPYDALMNFDVSGKYSVIGSRTPVENPLGHVGV